MNDEYPKVSEEICGEHPAVFELVLEEHVPYVNPASYGIRDLKGVNPTDYFITSGDAVEKARILEKDLWQFAGEMRTRILDLLIQEHKVDAKAAQDLYKSGTRPTKPKRFGEFENAAWKAAGQARSLLNSLRKAKGTNIFLETEFDTNHRLLCIPKNPRK